MAGTVERCDDDHVVGHLVVFRDRPHRHPEKIAAAALFIEDRDRFEAEFLEREIRNLGGLTASVNRHPATRGGAFVQHGAQVLPHFAIEMQRVVDELVREARLFGNSPRCNQVAEAVRLHVHALDVAFSHQALQIQVRQPEGDAQLRREAALRDARVLFNRFEQPQVAARTDIHAYVFRGFVRQTGPRPARSEGPADVPHSRETSTSRA